MKKRVLVYLHLYYHGQLPYFLQKIASVNGCAWDLVVTVSKQDAETERLLRAFRPDVTILPVENVGYDIWPFIAMLRSVDLSRYDYVLKLHTKNRNEVRNRVNGLNLRGFRWRNLLVDALLRSPRQFASVLSKMESDPQAGIACNAALIKKPSIGLAEDTDLLVAEMERLGLHPADRRFCAGTMFLSRIAPFERLVDADLTPDYFETVSLSHSMGTKAHVYERILSFVVLDAGYHFVPIASHPLALLKVRIHDLLNPLLHWVFSLERRGAERVKYLTILGMEFRLKK